MAKCGDIYTTKQRISRTYIPKIDQALDLLEFSASACADASILPLTWNGVVEESRARFMQQKLELPGKTVATAETDIENPDCTLDRIFI